MDASAVRKPSCTSFASSMQEPQELEAAAHDIYRAHILQIAYSFMSSRILFTAIKLDLFTLLDSHPLRVEQIKDSLGVNGRGLRAFLDALTALGLLKHAAGAYRATEAAKRYLSATSSQYIGPQMVMLSELAYKSWGQLDAALVSGLPQSMGTRGASIYDMLPHHPPALKIFMAGMAARSRAIGVHLARHFPWGEYGSVADIGAANGEVLIQILRKHEHLRGIGLDLPHVEPFFSETVALLPSSVQARIRFQGGDFFSNGLARADVVIFGHVLHNWSDWQRRLLLQLAYECISPGGRVIIYEAFVQPYRAELFSQQMSLTMLLETCGGEEFTSAACADWLVGAGFQYPHIADLPWPDKMVTAVRPQR